MKTTQVGAFAAGTYGLPVYVQLPDDLADPANANFLTGVSQISLSLTRPDGTHPTPNPRLLPLPASVTDVRGVVKWVTAAGDLNQGGVYTLALTVTLPEGDLVVDGDFTVQE